MEGDFIIRMGVSSALAVGRLQPLSPGTLPWAKENNLLKTWL